MKILQTIRTAVMAFAFIMFAAAPIMAVATPQAVAAGAACESRFLGLPAWFRGLTDDDCNITGPGQIDASGAEIELGDFIWRIALNVIEIGLFIVGYIALFFILYGGFQYLTGGANPGQLEAAKKTILNAVIGLAISMGSIAITNLIFGLLGA